MGVRCRDCGRESRLEPQCLERPSTPLIQLLFSCKSYQHFLLTPTITPHSWALFSLFTAHQGEGRERRQRDEAEEGKEKWNILAPDFNWQNGSALSPAPIPSFVADTQLISQGTRYMWADYHLEFYFCDKLLLLSVLLQHPVSIKTAKATLLSLFFWRTLCILAIFVPAHKLFPSSIFLG